MQYIYSIMRHLVTLTHPLYILHCVHTSLTYTPYMPSICTHHSSLHTYMYTYIQHPTCCIKHANWSQHLLCCWQWLIISHIMADNPRGTSFPIYKYIYVYTCVHESYSPILLSPHFSPSRRESKYAEAYIDLSYTHMLHSRSHIHRHTHIPTHMYAYLLNYAIFLSHVSCHKLTTLPNLYPYRYKQHI